MSALADSWLASASGSHAREFYTAIGVNLPDRGTLNVDVSCFSNPTAHNRGDRNASCSVSVTTGLWHCKACGQKGNAYQAALSLGYSEQRARELAQAHGLFLEAAPREDKPRLPNERQLNKWKQELRGSPVLMGRLRELKGWTPAAIVRCGLGWDGERITFAIRDKSLRRVGVVRYLPGGEPKMKSLPGSKRLLFPPPEVLSRRLPLFVVEGEPAAVSVRSVGLQAVGVPGVGGWRPEFAQRLWGFKRIVVLPDADFLGRDLAGRVQAAIPQARVVDLEPNKTDGSDVGDWIAEEAQLGGSGGVRRILEGLAV